MGKLSFFANLLAYFDFKTMQILATSSMQSIVVIVIVAVMFVEYEGKIELMLAVYIVKKMMVNSVIKTHHVNHKLT